MASSVGLRDGSFRGFDRVFINSNKKRDSSLFYGNQAIHLLPRPIFNLLAHLFLKEHFLVKFYIVDSYTA